MKSTFRQSGYSYPITRRSIKRDYAGKQSLHQLTGAAKEALEQAEDMADPTVFGGTKRTTFPGEWRDHANHGPSAYARARQFLRSRAGKSWDEIWSEVCKAYPAGSPMREAVHSEVDAGIINEDGSVSLVSKYGPRELSASYLPYTNEIFVDQFGMLHVNYKTKKFERKPQAYNAVTLNNVTYFLYKKEYFKGTGIVLSRVDALNLLNKDEKALYRYWDRLTTAMLLLSYKEFHTPKESVYVKIQDLKQLSTEEKKHMFAALASANLHPELFNRPEEVKKHYL
jgi:hypothetical protein